MKTDILKSVYLTSFITGIFIACFMCGKATATTDPQKYAINLDLPPEQRWTHVVKDYSKEIKDVIMEFRYVRVCLVSLKIDVSLAVIIDCPEGSAVIYQVFLFCVVPITFFSVDDYPVGKELAMIFLFLCYFVVSFLCRLVSRFVSRFGI